MSGLKRILKLYGQMKVGGELWVWDYLKDEPRKRSEMTKEEFAASEKKKYQLWKETKTVI